MRTVRGSSTRMISRGGGWFRSTSSVADAAATRTNQPRTHPRPTSTALCNHVVRTHHCCRQSSTLSIDSGTIQLQHENINRRHLSSWSSTPPNNNNEDLLPTGVEFQKKGGLHRPRQAWSSGTNPLFDEFEQEEEHALSTRELEGSTLYFLNHFEQFDRGHQTSGLMQHLLAWQPVLAQLPTRTLQQIMPPVDRMAHKLLDAAAVQKMQSVDNDSEKQTPLRTAPNITNVVTCVTGAIHGWAKLQGLVQQYSSNSHTTRHNRHYYDHRYNDLPACRAEVLLYRLERLHATTGDNQFQPHLETYNGVLDAWSKTTSESRDAAPERVTSLLQHMRRIADNGTNPMAQPNGRSWNVVLNAWASRGNADQTMALFHSMQHGEAGVLPDKFAYGILAKAWLRSNRAESAQRVQELLDQCKQQYEQHCNRNDSSTKDDDIPLSGLLFGTLIKLYGRQPEKAQQVLDDFLLWYQRTKYPDLQPLSRNFVPLMNAWAKRGEAEKVEELLLQMQQLYEDGNTKCRPTHLCFVVVIDAWSKRRTLQAAQHAESILYRMEEKFLDGNVHNRPEEDQMNAYGYNLVIDAYAHSGAEGAVRHVEAILARMKRLSRRYDNEHILPDKITYTSVMKAYIMEGKTGFADRVESILKKMEKEYKATGRASVKPDTITYGCVLDALSKGSKNQSLHTAERAEGILRRMDYLYKRGDAHVKPNEVCFNALLNIYAKQRNPVQAEEILRWMEHSSSGVSPTTVSYTICIDAWAKCIDAMPTCDVHAEKFHRARRLFDRMVARYKHRDMRCKPTVPLFCSLMMALARSDEPKNKCQVARDLIHKLEQMGVPIMNTLEAKNGFLHASSRTTGDDETMHEALKYCVMVFQGMRSTGGCGTDSSTYISMLHVINNLMQDESERDEAFVELFHKCREDGNLGSNVITTFSQLLPSTSDKAVLPVVDIDNSNALPPEWSRNTKD